jgi:hypothetical protein
VTAYDIVAIMGKAPPARRGESIWMVFQLRNIQPYLSRLLPIAA